MKRKNKKFQKKGSNSLNKLSLFQKSEGKLDAFSNEEIHEMSWEEIHDMADNVKTPMELY